MKMRDKISHPDVSMLSRTGTMYNGQGNLSNPIFHQSGDFPKTGNNLRHGGVTHSNNNELVQQQICTDDNGDDEFSDFQSAPTVSVSSAGKYDIILQTIAVIREMICYICDVMFGAHRESAE